MMASRSHTVRACSRPYLREAGGAIPPAYSPGKVLHFGVTEHPTRRGDPSRTESGLAIRELACRRRVWQVPVQTSRTNVRHWVNGQGIVPRHEASLTPVPIVTLLSTRYANGNTADCTRQS